MLSRDVVGWLLLTAGFLVFGCGIGVRVLVGRLKERRLVRKVVGGFRESTLARWVFGPVLNDPLDDEELDGIFIIPGIVAGCGFLLTGVFLLGMSLLD